MTVLAQVVRVSGVEFEDLPWADPEVIDVSLHCRFEIADDDPDLHRPGERGLAHSAHATARRSSAKAAAVMPSACTGQGGVADITTMRSAGGALTWVTHTPLWESARDWGPAD